jgi:phosphatidylserine/phosphatidylglycerophosphate/cardiolipin synthase-like enzyme
MGTSAATFNSTLVALFLATILAFAPAQAQLTDYSQIQSERVGSTDYPRIFNLARQLMIRQPLREYLEEKLPGFLELSVEDQKALDAPTKLNGITEGQLITLLQRRPDLMDSFEKFISETTSASPAIEQKESLFKLVGSELSAIAKDPEMKRAMYPLKPVDLWMQNGPSYTEELFVGHVHEVEGKTLPGDDLEGKMVEFIEKAQRELMINVFDFDSMKIADAIIRAKQRGVEVDLGIDEKNINRYERVQIPYKKMLDAGVRVQSINSVGLNHQKLFTRDWSMQDKAAAIDSSGNCTVSCVGKYGEGGEKLAGHPFAIPNANHLRVIQGWVPANLIHHEVSKTLKMKLHGTGETGFYPGGMFRLEGPAGAHKIVAFSPSGAADNINKYMIRSALLTSSGPLRMAQFVITSNEVGEALYLRAEKEMREKGHFDIKAIVDSLQSVAAASEILNMLAIGRDMKLNDKGDRIRFFTEDLQGRWGKLLGQKGLEKMRDQVRIPPAVYGNHSVDDVRMTSLMHHKVIISPESGLVMDGSFNISANALKNQEQFSLTYDPKMAVLFEGLFEGLYKQSAETVYQRVQKANDLAKKEKPATDETVDRRSAKLAAERIKNSKAPVAQPRIKAGPQCISIFGRAG